MFSAEYKTIPGFIASARKHWVHAIAILQATRHLQRFRFTHSMIQETPESLLHLDEALPYSKTTSYVFRSLMCCSVLLTILQTLVAQRLKSGRILSLKTLLGAIYIFIKIVQTESGLSGGTGEGHFSISISALILVDNFNMIIS